MPRLPGADEQLFEQRLRHSLMPFGLPAALLAFLSFLLVVAWHADQLPVPFLLLYVLFALVAAIETAMAALAARRVRVSFDAITGRTLFRDVRIPWDQVISIELVDRKADYPRRILLLTGVNSQFIVLSWIGGFDRLLESIRSHWPRHQVTPMPLWKRLVLLQWAP